MKTPKSESKLLGKGACIVVYCDEQGKPANPDFLPEGRKSIKIVNVVQYFGVHVKGQ